MVTERRVVDDRVLLLGLDSLYRGAMMRHERGELLTCARRVAMALRAKPASCPVEGYYAEDPGLTEYFRLIRTFQTVRESRTTEVSSLREFERLRTVVSSPLFGRPAHEGFLLPQGRDAMSEALIRTRPDWSVERLTAAARTAAYDMDDISLVGLAARIQDAVVLTALRESVVLYSEAIELVCAHQAQAHYVWNVDDDLAINAKRFVDTFNGLFGSELPTPEPERAEYYWTASMENTIYGRCVRLGHDHSGRHYHWAIRGTDAPEFSVHEFWQPEIWTSSRYSTALSRRALPPEL